MKLVSLAPASCEKLEQISNRSVGETRRKSVDVLAKFDPQRARPFITTLLQSNKKDVDCALWIIRLRFKNNALEWTELLTQNLAPSMTEDDFLATYYTIAETGSDFGRYFVEFLDHENPTFRAQSISALGKSPQQKTYLPAFIDGLNDPNAKVVHATLQALKGCIDEGLLTPFFDVSKRYVTDEHYILVNLEHRLKEYGYKTIAQFQRIHEFGPNRLDRSLRFLRGVIK
jgi:HEAT repeat protein